jgi:hypothetical protein
MPSQSINNLTVMLSGFRRLKPIALIRKAQGTPPAHVDSFSNSRISEKEPMRAGHKHTSNPNTETRHTHGAHTYMGENARGPIIACIGNV